MTIAEELRDRLKLKYMGDCKCGHCALVPDEMVARAADEIERLQASDLAWKMIAKQEARWNDLPQSEKEAALAKALESTIADFCLAEDEVERLRAALDKIAFYDDFMNKESAVAMLNVARDALGSYPVAVEQSQEKP